MSEWRDHAACVREPGNWFPDAGRNALQRADAVRDAAAICRQCPVRRDCATDALDPSIRSGVWAGIDLGEKADTRPTRKTKALRRIAGVSEGRTA